MSGYLETIIDHLNIGVSDVERSREFYEKTLAPLGLKVLLSIPPEKAEKGGEQEKTGGHMYGFGRDKKPLFWIVGNATPGTAMHIGFVARSHEEVDAFYRAALAAGGEDNGPPGERYYGRGYYGAFVHDPDGINIEAVVMQKTE